jgi:hypothetical protein
VNGCQKMTNPVRVLVPLLELNPYPNRTALSPQSMNTFPGLLACQFAVTLHCCFLLALISGQLEETFPPPTRAFSPKRRIAGRRVALGITPEKETRAPGTKDGYASGVIGIPICGIVICAANCFGGHCGRRALAGSGAVFPQPQPGRARRRGQG